MKISVAVLVSSLVVAVLAGDPSCNYPSSCPNIKPMENLDFKKYGGKWIEYYHGKGLDYKCAVFDYIYKDEPTPKYTLAMDAQEANGQPIKESDEIDLFDTCSNPKGSFLKFLGGYFPAGLVLFVLDTDYENYGVEYGCREVDGKIMEVICVQGREGKQLLDDQSIKALLQKNGLPEDILINSRPSSCN